MPIKKPESMEECVYMTQRDLGDGSGYVMAWVFRENCPKCNKTLMGKPRDKSGKVLIRAKEYVCPSCGNTEQKEEYESSLTVNVEYTCPKCKNNGEKQIPFKRKKIEGVETLRFQCDKCKSNIDITKKMKAKKSKDGEADI